MCQIVARGVVDNPNIAGVVVGATWHHKYPVSYVGFSRQQNIDNAEFVAHAREDLPWAVSRLEQLQVDIEHVLDLDGYDHEQLPFRLLQAALDRSRQEGT